MSGKRSNFVLEKSGKPQSDFCTNPVSMCLGQCARAGARCDYGLYLAGTVDNSSSVCKLASEAIGLKMYLNETFASLKMENMMQWMEVLASSPCVTWLVPFLCSAAESFV